MPPCSPAATFAGAFSATARGLVGGCGLSCSHPWLEPNRTPPDLAPVMNDWRNLHRVETKALARRMAMWQLQETSLHRGQPCRHSEHAGLPCTRSRGRVPSFIYQLLPLPLHHCNAGSAASTTSLPRARPAGGAAAEGRPRLPAAVHETAGRSDGAMGRRPDGAMADGRPGGGRKGQRTRRRATAGAGGRGPGVRSRRAAGLGCWPSGHQTPRKP